MFPVEGVGFVGEVTDELLGLGIDGEGDAEAGVDVLEAVGGEVFAHTGEGFGDRGVVLEGGIDLLRVGGFAEVEGMGAVVGEGGGEMAIFGSVEGALLAGEAGIDPVVDVVLAAFEFFDLLAVLVFHDAAGSVTAGKGAAFVFDDVADVDAGVGFDGVDVGTTVAFDADHGDTEFSIGSDGGGMGGEEGPSSGEDGGAEEVSAVHEFVEWCATCSWRKTSWHSRVRRSRWCRGGGGRGGGR